MNPRTIVHSAIFGLLAVALGCGERATPGIPHPAPPVGLADRHVMTLAESGLEDPRDQLPAQISLADAPRLLVAIPPEQIGPMTGFGLLQRSPRPSGGPFVRPSGRPSWRPLQVPPDDPTHLVGVRDYRDRVYVASGLPPRTMVFDPKSAIWYPVGDYYFPYARINGVYQQDTYANNLFDYSITPFLHDTSLGVHSPFYYYGLRGRPSALALQNATVTIGTGTGFQPDSVVIQAGGTVRWSSSDASTHAVAADFTGTRWTADLGPNQSSADVPFFLPGVYPYHCAYHPELHGTVVVE